MYYEYKIKKMLQATYQVLCGCGTFLFSLNFSTSNPFNRQSPLPYNVEFSSEFLKHSIASWLFFATDT